MADDNKDEKKPASGLDDYLNSPRKKQKSYVCLAYSHFFNADLASTVQSYLKTHFPNHALTYPRDSEDMAKNFSKLIKLLIIDDEFSEMSEIMELVKVLKLKKNNSNVPVLFLTSKPARLIEQYNDALAIFHEGDDYIDYTRVSTAQVLNKIKTALSTQNRRRSRRYKVDLPVSYYSLTQNKELPGQLVDFSLHGALLKTGAKDHLFQDLEQLKITLPLGGLNRAKYGDFLKVSAKVRRVKIAGDMAGVSFEYVSEKQLMTLTSFLMNLVNTQVENEARASRARNRS